MKSRQAAGLFLIVSSLVFSSFSRAGTSPVKSACEFSYPPFCLVDSNRQAAGFSVDLLRAALQAMHREVTFQTGPWDEIKNSLARGTIEALPLVGRTPERENFFDYTFPYISFGGAIVVRENCTDILGTGDLKGRRVAVMKGDNADEFLRRTNYGAVVIAVPTFVQALKMLSDGGCDAVIIQRLLGVRLIQDSGFANLRMLEKPVEGLKQDFCFAVHKGNRKLLSVLNEGLSLVIADGTFSRLQSKWFGNSLLSSKAEIVIATSQDFPPYSLQDHNGNPAGFNVDLTRAVAEAVGLKVKIINQPWSIIRGELEAGAIDAASIFYSEERDRKLDFTPPFAVICNVFFARRNTAGIAADSIPTRKKIIVTQGGIMHDYLLAKGLAGNLILARTHADAIRMLAAGQGDYALVARLPGLYWINELRIRNLKIAGPFLVPANYGYAVHDGNNGLLQRLNEGLAIVKSSGQYRQIYDRWLGVLEPRGTLPKYLWYLFAALATLLALFLAWTFSLRKQVGRRTAELNREIERHKLSLLALEQSREKWEALFETFPVGVTVLDESGAVVDYNPAICRILEITGRELKAGKFRERNYCKADGSPLLPHEYPSWQAIHNKINIHNSEIGIRTGSGKEIWTRVSAAPLHLPGIACVLSTTDITAQKRMETALIDSSERLSLAASSAQLGVWDWNLVDNSLQWDDRMLAIYGIDRTAFTGTVDAWHNSLHPDDRQKAVDEVNQALRDGKPYDAKFRIIRPDGTIALVKTNGTVICDKEHQPVRMIGINGDITNLAKLEEALARAQKLESLGTLAGGIAHDFNNLLCGIFGYIDLASSCSNREKAAEYLNKSLTTLDRARGLTGQLLTFAKGGAPIKSVERLMPFLREMVTFNLSGSNISSSFSMPEDLWPCDIDRNQIGQVIDNIIINAQQAMPGGGTVVVSAVNLRVKDHPDLNDGNYVKISFADEGEGMSPGTIAHIFDPFFTTKPKGHGLGLATCYSIVKRHGGKIEVESVRGAGSVFHIYLPSSPDAVLTIGSSAGKVEKGSGSILVMDDEEFVLDLSREMLESLGYSAVLARDGREMLSLVKNGIPGGGIVAMIFDLTIPGGMGGREAIVELRKIDPRVPVFVSSGYAADPVMASPAEYGFTGSICKPFLRHELSKLFSDHLG